HFRAGDLREAERLWGRVAEQLPTDLDVRSHLFDLAVRAGDDAAAQRLAKEFRRIEGDNGVLWRHAEASRLVLAARKRPDPGGLAEARRLLAEAAARRPSWPKPAILEADIALLEGNADGAIEAYRRAVDLGAGDPEVARRLVRLLYSRQRYKEAEETL